LKEANTINSDRQESIALQELVGMPDLEKEFSELPLPADEKPIEEEFVGYVFDDSAIEDQEAREGG
jgi:hypothetical protein